MASTLTRRPVPALIALVALLLLTGLVWWRVLNRDSGGSPKKACSTPTTSAGPALTTLPAPSSITIQVLNSTDKAGIAAAARTTLVGLGFLSPATATNDAAKHNKIPGVAEIRYTPATAKAAKTVSFYLPGATLVPVTGTSTTVVVSLGAKYHAVATAAQASAAMAQARVQVGGGSTPTPSSSSPSC